MGTIIDVKVIPQIGDVIQLNSGGPLMTITEVKNEYVCAQWFTETAEPYVLNDSFYPGTFRKAESLN